ncbi:MAG: hypothetical protein K5Q00_05635 [Gammaproteobacteria bacterium]|nr:hypothetical protein [Gammaproteobacteria bacterium]
MNIFERPIRISIHKNMDGRKDGIIWHWINGVVKQIPFMIDKPQLVKKGLNPTTYNRVVRQIIAMGIEPDTIELHVGGTNYVYDGKLYRNKIGIPMAKGA